MTESEAGENTKVLENDADRAKLALECMKQSWDNFERRRNYEWKLSLGVWTAIAAFAGLAFEHDRTDACAHPLWVLGVCVLIAVVHFSSLFYIMRANNTDKNIAIEYRRYVTSAIAPNLNVPNEPIPKHNGLWSPILQTLITILLLVVAGFASLH